MIPFFVVIFLLFLYICRDTNFYKLIMIFGKKGSGKTSYIAKKSQYYIKKGYTVYTNCHVDGTLQFNPKHIGVSTFPPESVVFCDEAGIIWNNRDYKNFQKCLIEWFKYQRQYKIRFYLFSQVYDDTDKVLRSLTDTMYIVRRLGMISILRPIVKKIGIATDTDGNGQIVDTFSYGSIFSTEITFLPRWYGFFKSFNPPPLPEIQATQQAYSDFSEMALDTRKWLLFHVRRLYNRLSADVRRLCRLVLDKAVRRTKKNGSK